MNNNQQQPKQQLTKLAGLYKKTSANGNEYFTGKFGPLCRVLILANKDAGQQRDWGTEPDYYLCICEDGKGNGTPYNSQSNGYNGTSTNGSATAPQRTQTVAPLAPQGQAPQQAPARGSVTSYAFADEDDGRDPFNE